VIEKLYKYFPLEAGRSPKLQQLFPCLPTRIKYIRCFFENSIKRVFFYNFNENNAIILYF